jgi:hypothetical protein
MAASIEDRMLFILLSMKMKVLDPVIPHFV